MPHIAAWRVGSEHAIVGNEVKAGLEGKTTVNSVNWRKL
jgi:hypothetical protein